MQGKFIATCETGRGSAKKLYTEHLQERWDQVDENQDYYCGIYQYIFMHLFPILKKSVLNNYICISLPLILKKTSE
jgi:hypothetical protein